MPSKRCWRGRLNGPEAGFLYRVGVHYRAGNGFGPSNARVGIYVQGRVVGDFSHNRLAAGEFWEVAVVDAVAGDVVTIDTVTSTIP